MTDLRREIGNAIREARRARGWSQHKLAIKAGLQQHQVSTIEAGIVDVRLDTVARLLAELDGRLHVEFGIERLRLSA